MKQSVRKRWGVCWTLSIAVIFFTAVWLAGVYCPAAEETGLVYPPIFENGTLSAGDERGITGLFSCRQAGLREPTGFCPGASHLSPQVRLNIDAFIQATMNLSAGLHGTDTSFRLQPDPQLFPLLAALPDCSLSGVIRQGLQYMSPAALTSLLSGYFYSLTTFAEQQSMAAALAEIAISSDNPSDESATMAHFVLRQLVASGGTAQQTVLTTIDAVSKQPGRDSVRFAAVLRQLTEDYRRRKAQRQYAQTPDAIGVVPSERQIVVMERLRVESVIPTVRDGLSGSEITVSVTALRDGHDPIRVQLGFHKKTGDDIQTTDMQPQQWPWPRTYTATVFLPGNPYEYELFAQAWTAQLDNLLNDSVKWLQSLQLDASAMREAMRRDVQTVRDFITQAQADDLFLTDAERRAVDAKARDADVLLRRFAGPETGLSELARQTHRLLDPDSGVFFSVLQRADAPDADLARRRQYADWRDAVLKNTLTVAFEKILNVRRNIMAAQDLLAQHAQANPAFASVVNAEFLNRMRSISGQLDRSLGERVRPQTDFSAPEAVTAAGELVIGQLESMLNFLENGYRQPLLSLLQNPALHAALRRDPFRPDLVRSDEVSPPLELFRSGEIPALDGGVITDVLPLSAGGNNAVKATVGVPLSFQARVWIAGTKQVRLRYRKQGAVRWMMQSMHPASDDTVAAAGSLWQTAIRFADEPESLGLYEYSFEVASDGGTRRIFAWDQARAPAKLYVDRRAAVTGFWSELFPRSHGGFGPDNQAHLRQVVQVLKDMGTTVIYLPPVHPIGRKNRKGFDGRLVARKDGTMYLDPGSPWAVADHRQVAPELGTVEDFAGFVRMSKEFGMEVALDVALQAAPDHVWAHEHPDWFHRQPDGTIQYAQNPPKQYQDVYPFNFQTADWQAQWQSFLAVMEFWIAQGVTIFRVDNPHTKPINFWRWAIRRIQSEHPNVLFLAEAFSDWEMQLALTEAGFTYSYTHVPYMDTPGQREFRELMFGRYQQKELFRANHWPTTPDILPKELQIADPEQRQRHYMRTVFLSAMSGGVWGMNTFSTVLMEHEPIAPGKEELARNEKFSVREWDLSRVTDSPMYLVVAELNRLRERFPALQTGALTVLKTDNDRVAAFARTIEDRKQTVIVVLNLDTEQPQHAWLQEVPWERLGIVHGERYRRIDVLHEDAAGDADAVGYTTDDAALYELSLDYGVTLDGQSLPQFAHVFLIEPVNTVQIGEPATAAAAGSVFAVIGNSI